MKNQLSFLALLLLILLTSCVSHPELRSDPGLAKSSIQVGKSNDKDPLVSPYYPQTAQGEKNSGSISMTELTAPIDKPLSREDLQPNKPSAKGGEKINEDEGLQLTEELPQINLDPKTLKESKVIGHDDLIEKELKRIMAEFGEKDSRVPPIFLNEVKACIKTFQSVPQYRKFIANSLRRGAVYMPLVKEVFKYRGLPEDMAYIAFVESGFNRQARSRAGALGLWQFMSGTAQDYALKVNKKFDERLDPVKSTLAAADYFHDLVAIFGPGSFLLALAAYNCGEGKVIACLKKIENPMEQRNFWHIRNCLAKETREYPPKIIAAAIVGNNPEVFGFPKFEDDGSGREALAAWVNQREGGSGPIPAVYRITSVKDEDSAPSKNQIKKNSKKAAPPKPILYTVKKGNTLDLIAEAFNVEKEELKKWNHLKSREVKVGHIIKIYACPNLKKIRYQVRKGDTLSEISQSFRVRPMHIVVVNGMKNGWEIKTGETLILYKGMKSKPFLLTVKKGATLNGIADRFDVRAREIMRWNNLGTSVIHPGQRLKIYPPLSHEA